MNSLIAEDDPINSLLLETFLSNYGQCTVVQDGKAAVKAFRFALETHRRYHLVCMDVMMPGLDGHQAVRVIRASERARRLLPRDRTKIIMTTALSDRETVIQSAREECDAYMVKPVDTGRLLSHLREFGLVEDLQDAGGI